jgi:hypothetical protein
MNPYDSMYGLKVVTDEKMVDRVWVFPKDRFVEYEPKDEWWCRKYGFGHEEVRPKQEVVRVGDTLCMHPAVWKQMGEQALFLEKAADRVVKKMSDDLCRKTSELDGPARTFVEGGVSTADVLKQAQALKNEWRREELFANPLPLPSLDWDFMAVPSRLPTEFAPHRNLVRVDDSPFLLTTV